MVLQLTEYQHGPCPEWKHCENMINNDFFYFCWPHFITTEGGVGEHEVMITTLPSYRGTIRHSCGICCFGALLQRGFSNIFIAQPRRKQTTTGIYMRGLRNHRQFLFLHCYVSDVPSSEMKPGQFKMKPKGVPPSPPPFSVLILLSNFELALSIRVVF